MSETIPFDALFQQYSAVISWGGFLFGLVLYGIFSAILVYHWRTYAIGAIVIRRTFWWYFLTTGILIAVALMSLLWATV